MSSRKVKVSTSTSNLPVPLSLWTTSQLFNRLDSWTSLTSIGEVVIHSLIPVSLFNLSSMKSPGWLDQGLKTWFVTSRKDLWFSPIPLPIQLSFWYIRQPINWLARSMTFNLVGEEGDIWAIVALQYVVSLFLSCFDPSSSQWTVSAKEPYQAPKDAYSHYKQGWMDARMPILITTTSLV